MFNFNDNDISFLIASPEIIGISQLENNHRNNVFLNTLYSMNFSITAIQSYNKGVYEKNFVAITNEDNNKLRQESLFIMQQFNLTDIIVKYKGNNFLTRIMLENGEYALDINYYDNNPDKKTYIHEGVSFTLTERKRYFFPKKKEELNNGMIVEYFNNNVWYKKEISNVDLEYEKMYKLLMKYEKLRVNY